LPEYVEIFLDRDEHARKVAERAHELWANDRRENSYCEHKPLAHWINEALRELGEGEKK